MALTKVVKQGDTANSLELQFEYAVNVEDLEVPIGSNGNLSFVNIDTGLVIVDTPITITDVSAGIITVIYEWAPTDLDTPGRYRGELMIALGGNGNLYMPTTYYVNLLIIPNLA